MPPPWIGVNCKAITIGRKSGLEFIGRKAKGMQVERVADDRLVVHQREKSANRWLLGGAGLVAIIAVVLALAAKDLPVAPIAMTVFVGAIVATLFIRPAIVTTATFDKASDSLVIVRKRRDTVLDERRIVLSQIAAAVVTDGGGANNFSPAVTVGDECVDLATAGLESAEEAERVAIVLRHFLGLPDGAGTANVEEFVKS